MNNNKNTTTTENNNGWEGYGGPIAVSDGATSGRIPFDPTLDACCQREMESQQRQSALQTTLRKYDVSLIAERRRRNLVTTRNFDGCRCCYDPNIDGQEDYPALQKLRRQQQQRLQQQQQQRLHEEQEKEKDKEKNHEDTWNDNNHDDDNNLDKQDTNSTASAASSESTDYDYLLDELEDDNDPNNTNNSALLQEMEERRRFELEMLTLQNEISIQHGYGTHRQIHPSRVLKLAGLSATLSSKSLSSASSLPPPAVVLHLYNYNSIQSAALDLYLEETFTITGAATATNNNKKIFRGTQFIRSEGRTTMQLNEDIVSQVFPSSLLHGDDSIFPALVAIRDGTVVNVCPKLQGLVLDNNYVDIDEYDENDDDNNDILDKILCKDAIDQWLDRSGVLLCQHSLFGSSGGGSMNSNMSMIDRLLEQICHLRPEEEALMDYLAAQTQTTAEDEIYCCGLPYCQKTFPHEHVGYQTEQQDGLLVPESDIVSSS